MELRLYQRNWHGVDLTRLPAAAAVRDKPAGPEFYAEFYAALAAGQGCVDPAWIEGKRSLGRELASLFTKWEPASSILAVASGRAYVEAEWIKDFEVTFNDCQDSSLAALRERHPGAKCLVGDAHTLQPVERFDIITLITLDYALRHNDLAALLTHLANLLNSGGRIVLYCASTLSWRQFAAETVKHLTSRYRRIPHIFWGWWRSPAEFFKLGRSCGLHTTAYSHTATGLTELPRWRSTWMSLSSSHFTVVYQANE